MSFAVKKDPKGVVIVTVDGQLIVGNRQELKQKITEALEKGERKFLIDFTNTGYIDSSGLGVLVSLSRKIREADGELQFVAEGEAALAELGVGADAAADEEAFGGGARVGHGLHGPLDLLPQQDRTTPSSDGAAAPAGNAAHRCRKDDADTDRDEGDLHYDAQVAGLIEHRAEVECPVSSANCHDRFWPISDHRVLTRAD